MFNKENFIKKITNLRKENKTMEAIDELKNILNKSEYVNDAELNYQLAWCYDSIEKESEAVQFYETAIKNGLNKNDLWEAYLGLGSTYRTIGEYSKSKLIFEEGIKKFPENKALKVFYAMTLYNLKEYKKSTELLLKLISNNSNDKNIMAFKEAIEYYSEDIEKIFK
ncbi:tetratricopeptide repeat protein [Oceanotoga sp. DSM 15011]|uniref:tetratricopeptide repeat protein n=1 Tax=Oceanotoga sp. DSM 15011 TaxID=2984951 RepID=UPI0021F46540|nr:tetratricopeptide repeat protein [Oceanotoga sp. DSM 15011]UYP01224.1 tetratricopeptide repeat protein [Oceanotoga sp. DSM 15011]